MADSPLQQPDGVLCVSIFSNGARLADDVELISMTIQRAVNQVPSARLEFADGDMSTGAWPLSDKTTLIPGVVLRMAAGFGGDEQTLFEGVVVKHAIHIRADNKSCLVVECRDKALVMTAGRKNAGYSQLRDSDLMSRLIRDAGLHADVQATAVTCPQLVQYDVSDWDFVVARAEANGMLVVATDGTVAVGVPDVSSAPAISVSYGRDLLSFEAELDAGSQCLSTSALAWDPKVQGEVVAKASSQALNAQGNLDSRTLAQAMGAGGSRIQAGVPMAGDALQGWAKARQVRADLARIRGRVGFQGSAKARVGGLIELLGVGERFSGLAFTSAVRHQISNGEWFTEVDFGLAPGGVTEGRESMAAATSAPLSGIAGLQIGKVLKLDGDPQGEHRVQVKIPALGASAQAVWARLMQFHASSGFGSFFVPEPEDEVVLGFFNHDPSHPVILGGMHSSRRPPPFDLAQDNAMKAIVLRAGLKLAFDEQDQAVTVCTPAGNTVVLSDQARSLVLCDQNGNRVRLDQGGVAIDSVTDIALRARGRITLDADSGVGISSQAGDVKASGLNVCCEGRIGFSGKGAASAELSASGQTTVRGAMVLIN